MVSAFGNWFSSTARVSSAIFMGFGFKVFIQENLFFALDKKGKLLSFAGTREIIMVFADRR